MNRMNKINLLLIAGILILGLAACSTEHTEVKPKEDTQQVTNQEKKKEKEKKESVKQLKYYNEKGEDITEEVFKAQETAKRQEEKNMK